MSPYNASHKTDGTPRVRRGILAFCEEKGVLTLDETAKAVELMREKRPRLGEILVRRRILAIGDVMKVLAVQAERPDCFGEIALELGMLDPGALHAALEHQGELTPDPMTVLVAAELISAEAAIDVLSQYVDTLEREVSGVQGRAR